MIVYTVSKEMIAFTQLYNHCLSIVRIAKIKLMIKNSH